MTFKIDIKKGNILGSKDDDDTTVGEAIETIYPDYDNDYINIWLTENLRICLDFRGDISDIYDDLIDMLNNIQSIN